MAETDYQYEAANTDAFSAAMERRGSAAVTAPKVVPELSSRRVLVTEWVDGTRLDLDASPDVPRLCGVAINAYLTMLLDKACSRLRPPGGNGGARRRGKLVILDWGMTQAVPEDLQMRRAATSTSTSTSSSSSLLLHLHLHLLTRTPFLIQYSLIEFIAHVNSEDYDAMPRDFVNLGFTPESQLERVRQVCHARPRLTPHAPTCPTSHPTPHAPPLTRYLTRVPRPPVEPHRGPLVRPAPALPRAEEARRSSSE